MLGNNLYKTEVNADMSPERLKSLTLFYTPLIGSNALYLYLILIIKGSSIGFEELNSLLAFINISIDEFEKRMSLLNAYKLVKTLKKKDEDKYIFIVNNVLECKAFIKNDIFVRDFILKTSGEHFKAITSNIYSSSSHDAFDDVSSKLDLEPLKNWNSNNESFLNSKEDSYYNFDTLFNVELFLKDISTNLLPLRFRTKENMQEMAKLCDIYNISYDKMRNYLPRIARSNSDYFDLKLLKTLCENSFSEYHTIDLSDYNVPCLLYFMALQNGKEASPNDKKILYTLSNDYNLKPAVINVLISHALENCDNRLLTSYIYPIASDLHRNNIETANDALNMLKKNETKTIDVIPKYDASNNFTIDSELLNELLKNRGNND